MLVAGNWKMYKGAHEARAFAARLRHLPDRATDVDVVLCPPYVSLAAALQGLGSDSRVRVYAQNVHWDLEGAFTGEVSAPMLLELGVRGTIVGHSERRHYFGETDETVGKRAAAAVEAGLNVIACVGETEAERERDETEAVLERQVRVLPAHERLVIAYEPVWAIGTGVNASPTQAAEVQGYLRGLLSELASKEIAQTVRILYGGSVKAENAEVLLAEPEVDGALVGGASLNAQSFIGIVRKAARIGTAAKE
jgi:triosephosphate isomerase